MFDGPPETLKTLYPRPQLLELPSVMNLPSGVSYATRYATQ